MRYLLGSSYFDGGREFRKEFSRVWHWNTLKYFPRASKVVIVAEGGSQPALVSGNTDVIRLTGDLGHVGAHLSGEKKHTFTGWSASMCALAMLAYVNEADFLYKEEDTLAFGPCEDQMYSDLGDGQMVFGHAMRTPPYMEASQSLFLVRHAFIPTMVSEYLAMGKDGDLQNLGERKFWNIERKHGTSVVRRLSFGVDRERPIPWDAPVFYFQQPKPEELNEAHRRGLI